MAIRVHIHKLEKDLLSLGQRSATRNKEYRRILRIYKIQYIKPLSIHSVDLFIFFMLSKMAC